MENIDAYVWSTFKVEELINLYKITPELWNTSHVNYKRERINYYQEIANKLGIDVNLVKPKIDSLREKYYEELRNFKKHENNYSISWPYFKSLNFLEQYETQNHELENIQIDQCAEDAENEIIWTDELKLYLIKNLKNQPILWYPEYPTNDDLIENALKDIAVKFNVSTKCIKTEINKLETEFQLEYEKTKVAEANNEAYSSTYKFYKELQFLSNSQLTTVPQDIQTVFIKVENTDNFIESTDELEEIEDNSILDEECKELGKFITHELRCLKKISSKDTLKRAIKNVILEYSYNNEQNQIS